MQELSRKEVIFHAIAVLGPLAASWAISTAVPSIVPPVGVPLGWLGGSTLIYAGYAGKRLNDSRTDEDDASSNPTLALPSARIEDYEPVTPQRLAQASAQLEYARKLFKTRAFYSDDLRVGLGVLVTEENQRFLPEARNVQQLPELPTQSSPMPTGFANPAPTASPRAAVPKPKPSVPDFRVERPNVRVPDAPSELLDEDDFDFDSPTWLETEPEFDDDAPRNNGGFTYPAPDEFFVREQRQQNRNQQPSLPPEQYYTQSLIPRWRRDGVDEED